MKPLPMTNRHLRQLNMRFLEPLSRRSMSQKIKNNTLLISLNFYKILYRYFATRSEKLFYVKNTQKIFYIIV